MLPRILIVAPFARLHGGAETMLDVLVSGLEADERANVSIAFFEDGPMVDRLRAAGAATFVLAPWRVRTPLHMLRAVRAIRQLIATRRPEVVLAWLGKMQLVAAPAALSFGRRRPAVMWWQHLAPRRHWVDVSASVIPADLIGCSSRAIERAQQALAPHRRTAVAEPGCRARLEVPRRDARTGYGISDTAFVVAVIGRLQRWKRQDDVLQAVAGLRAAGDDVHVIVVGGDAYDLDPDFTRHLHALARNLAVPTTFTGHVEDLSPVLSAADVVVNASDGEPFGITLIEAMSAARPVVALGRFGPLEIVQHGTTGLLVDTPGPAQLQGALARLCREPGLAERMGAAAFARWNELYTPDASALRFRRLVETAARTRQPPGRERGAV